jgi:hypothetical protein
MFYVSKHKPKSGYVHHDANCSMVRNYPDSYAAHRTLPFPMRACRRCGGGD